MKSLTGGRRSRWSEAFGPPPRGLRFRILTKNSPFSINQFWTLLEETRALDPPTAGVGGGGVGRFDTGIELNDKGSARTRDASDRDNARAGERI